MTTRKNVSVTISDENAEAMDRLMKTTGLNRSRLYDMALRKFVIWAASVDPYHLVVMGVHEAESAYPSMSRRDSGMRKKA